MEKKLIEVSSRLDNGDYVNKNDENSQGHISKSNISKKSMLNLDDSELESDLSEINDSQEIEKTQETKKTETKPKTTRKRTSSGSQSGKGTTSKRKRKTKPRKMDSDITGGIDF